MKRFALAGNPNCGKTTLFNNLTGSTAHVGNWPGVTVEKKNGVYKKLSEPISIIDLPGIYSLSPYTSEEVVSRNYILDEKPDCVINIVDATNLERNLYLTSQLLEIDVPVVVAVNMMDVLEKAGDKLDEKILSDRLGVPVVKISALEESNLEDLMKVAFKASQSHRDGSSIIYHKDLNHLIGDVKIAFKGKNVENPLFHAIKLVENDEIETKMHEDLLPMVDDFKKTFNDETFGDDIEAIIADERYQYISKNFAKAITRHEPKPDENQKENKSDRIDKVLTHKVFGLLIFAAILFLVFHFTFSENLFFLGGLFEDVVPSFEGTMYEGLFWTDAGINSPGVILFNFFDMSFSGIIEAVGGAMESGLGEGHWLTGFLCDGVLSGLFAILGFLPQILVLFLFFSIMEDTGYMARVAFILDRIFRKFGLSGRAFIPMIMGFGCSVPAMVNTRTLADENEKISTIRVIPFFSCGAKLPILVAIAGGIAEQFGFGNVDLITYSMYCLGIIVAIVAVLFLRHTTLKGDAAPFIMELPQYHWPQFKSLMIHLWDKAKHFVKKAFTIILASQIVIWFLSSFGWNWHMVDSMQDSILGSIGMLIQPIFTPLGFGSQLTSIGWVFAVAAITGLIAKEDVIATFIALGAAAVAYINSGNVDPAILEALEADEEGVTAVVTMIQASGITWQGCISFIAFNMLTIPCFAACATAKAELKEGTFKWTLLFWIVTSLLGSTFVYCFLSMFSADSLAWAIPVTLVLIGLGVGSIFLIRYLNNKKVKVA
ncbi:MAG: ferrous iron transport protein B [Bacilli bacterium]|nr:ferrous iron transport protein B [Bacilli bacterium]